MKQQVQTGALIALVVIGIVLALILLQKLVALALIVLIAIVISNGIMPGVQWLQRLTARWWRMPRALAVLLLLVSALLVFAGLFTFLIVTAVNEALNFSRDTWPTMQVKLMAWMGGLSQRYPIIPTPDVWLRQLSQQSGQITAYLFTTTRAVFGFVGGLFSLLPVFILTFFFTTAREGITYTLRQFIPPQYHERVMTISHLAGEKMGGWLRGQVLLALIITGLTMLGMLALGIPYAMLISIIGGIGELVPLIGPGLASVPAVLIAMALGLPLWKILVIVAFFLLLTQVENYLLAPRVMEQQVELAPITTILVLFTGATLLGLVGALLAVPVAAATRVILLEAVFPAIQGKSRQDIELGRHFPVDPEPAPTKKRRRKTAA